MRNVDRADEDLEMRSHYDFEDGVRGKYASRFATGCTVVALDPDIAEAFPDASSVNATLREILTTRRKTAGQD